MLLIIFLTAEHDFTERNGRLAGYSEQQNPAVGTAPVGRPAFRPYSHPINMTNREVTDVFST